MVKEQKQKIKRERENWREKWTSVIISKDLGGSIFVLVILIWGWMGCHNQDEGEKMSRQTTHTHTNMEADILMGFLIPVLRPVNG